MQVWDQTSAVGAFLWAGEGTWVMEWSKQAVFFRGTALTCCLRLRDRAQCPDQEPVGQATQNHLQGGDIALSQRASPLLCPVPFLALYLGLHSALLQLTVTDLVRKVPQGWESLPW